MNDANVRPIDKDWIKTWYPPRNIVDLLTIKYYNDSRTAGLQVYDAINPDAHKVTDSAIAANKLRLFPRELVAGLKMNLNRPFDNWVPPKFNSIRNREQPGMFALYYDSHGGSPLTDISNNPVPADQVSLSQQARQLHARHLYVLMMLLREAGVVQFFSHPALATPRKEKLTTRRIAQWAINAVGFMTPDLIMTPFEYDENPFFVDALGQPG